MTSVLLIYFLLLPSHEWQFILSEPASRSFCEMEAVEVAKMFKDDPGNMRVICVDDERVAI